MTKIEKRGKKPIPKEDLIKDLLKVAAQLQQDYVGINQYKMYGVYSVGVYSRHFGSWNKAVSMVGLKPYVIFTEEELLEDLKRVAKEIKPDKISAANYEPIGKYASTTYVYRFGNWTAAVIKAGLTPAKKTTK